MIGMRVIPIWRKNDLRPRQSKNRRERSAGFKVRLQAAIRQTKVFSPVKFQNLRGRRRLGRAERQRPVRSRFTRREVNDAATHPGCLAHTQNPTNSNLGIVRMRGNDKHIQRASRLGHEAILEHGMSEAVHSIRGFRAAG